MGTDTGFYDIKEEVEKVQDNLDEHIADINNPHQVKTTVPEQYTGSDCSGSDGAANRVLTLANTTLSSEELVFVDGFCYRKDTHYTVSHKASDTTITFTGIIYDDQNIDVRYEA